MKKPSLADCTASQLSRFTYDHIDAGGFTLATDSHTIWLGNAKSRVDMSRAQFNRLVRGWLKPRRFVRKAIIFAAGLIMIAGVGCATPDYTAEDHQVALTTAIAIRANVPRDIAKARERGPAAVEKERQRSQRWLLGTKRCSPEDRQMLDAWMEECLAFKGSYADAKKYLWRDRWDYISGVITSPSCVRTQ